ncbi:MAG: lipid A deacylase LpxR family protein [Wenzhouxiangella sp.]
MLAAFLALGTAGGHAATPDDADASGERDPAIWIVEYENDIFSGQDRYYSSGVRLSRIADARTPPSWLESVARRFPGFDEADTLPYRLSIGHNIYTPADIENPAPPPADRPYAGWLNVQFATGTLHPKGADRVRVALGWVGPGALGEKIQKSIHSAIGSPAPVGWEDQISNEATLQVGYDRFRRFITYEDRFDLAWFGGTSLGTPHTHLSVGGFARFGNHMPEGYGPPRITPAISGSGYFSPRPVRSWYVYAGIEGRHVLRDMFLQGNTFGGVDGVGIKRQVGEVFGGAVYSHGAFRVAYTHVWRSREFDGQVEPHNYGALSFSLWW